MEDPCPAQTHSYGTSWSPPTSRPAGSSFASYLDGRLAREVDAGPFGIYTLFQMDGQDVAGMMSPTPDTPGNGSYWHSYIAVEDVDECAKRAASLGGSVLVAPHEVPEFGRVCAIADPTGAVAHLVEPAAR